VNDTELRLCVVHGLKEARAVADEVKAGTCAYDLVEVMACPGGCVGGAGQPVANDPQVRRRRAKGLYDADKIQALHKAQDNPYINEVYAKTLGEVGGEKAHHLLHTQFHSRRRITDEGLPLIPSTDKDLLQINVCVGTSCYVRGAQTLLTSLVRHLEANDLTGKVNVQASFCFERCDRGPTVTIGDRVLERCTLAQAIATIDAELAKKH